MFIPKNLFEYHIRMSSKFLYQCLSMHRVGIIKKEDALSIGTCFYSLTRGIYDDCISILPDLYKELLEKEYKSIGEAEKEFHKICENYASDYMFLADLSPFAYAYYFDFFVESFINTLHLMCEPSDELDFDAEWCEACLSCIMKDLVIEDYLQNLSQEATELIEGYNAELLSSLNNVSTNILKFADVIESLYNLVKPYIIKSLPYLHIKEDWEVMPRYWRITKDASCLDYTAFIYVPAERLTTASGNTIIMIGDYIFIVRSFPHAFEVLYEHMSNSYIIPEVGFINGESGVFKSFDDSLEYKVRKIDKKELKRRLLINKFDDLEKDYGLYT